MNSSVHCSDPPLTAAEVEEKLDQYLAAALSSRRTAGKIAESLSRLDRTPQEFVLHWTGVAARSNAELAYQFATLAPTALAVMGAAGAEQWVLHAMDVFDKQGLYPACAVLKDIEGYARSLQESVQGVAFEEVAPVLELFLCGLSGRRLKLARAAQTYTDTAAVYLPERILSFPHRSDNLKLYKAIAAHLWAQTYFGTFQIDFGKVCDQYPQPRIALDLFNHFEAVRLDACLYRSLPALVAAMENLRSAPREDRSPPGYSRLRKPEATAEDSLALVEKFYPAAAPPAWCYMGSLFPERVESIRRARLQREKEAFRAALASFGKTMRTAERGPEARDQVNFSLSENSDTQQPGTLRLRLNVDGKPVDPPQEVVHLMESIVQDLGTIPPDYLVPAGEGGYRNAVSEENKAADVWKGVYHEEGAYLYNEWDCRRRHYRKDWCVLRELDVHPGDAGFVPDTLRKYAGQVIHLRRAFEALRGEDRRLKKQPAGDDLDLDAIVESYADMRRGTELAERLHTRRIKAGRDMAVMVMVDMSGSTKGWINDSEREALVMLCEALEVLGDRYAVYGFSGITRKRCETYRVKRFDENYSQLVKQRIAGITPQDYTRMGVAIRHLARLLNEVDARTKLLVTLSDGKPDDYSDGYRGEYGIEDTRQALIEAKRGGIHPFCITIDREAGSYLPHMYGAAHYVLIDDVRRLPLKVADIYRRLTA